MKYLAVLSLLSLPAPELADGTPDLSGVWMGGGSDSSDITKALKPGDYVSMQPWAEKVTKERLAADDPERSASPSASPQRPSKRLSNACLKDGTAHRKIV